MKRRRLIMLTVVLALAFAMEQADLGVVQSLYGRNKRMNSCSPWSDTITLKSWLNVDC